MPEPGRLTFLLGGARSGKSAHAERLVRALPPPWSYIATAQSLDAEMTNRILQHKARRGEGWQTTEAPLLLLEALDVIPEAQPVLVDCLTLWLSNHLLAGHDLDEASGRLSRRLSKPRGPWFVVSNEVGLGIVPDNALARRFRDAAGRLHQEVAAVADEVLFLVAGLPMKVK